MHAVIEQRQQRLQRLDADAGITFRQHVGAQRHRRAHGAHGQRRIDAGGMTAQQVQLQPRQVGLVDPRFGEVAEAGVHTVDRRITVGLRVHDRAGRQHALTRVGRETDLDAVVGDRKEIGRVRAIAESSSRRNSTDGAATNVAPPAGVARSRTNAARPRNESRGIQGDSFWAGGFGSGRRPPGGATSHPCNRCNPWTICGLGAIVDK